MIQEAIARVQQMEQYFDMLQSIGNKDSADLREDGSYIAVLQILTRYYESGQWLHDYELDEKGAFPQDLKRGILAQDAVYDFLQKISKENNTK